MKIESSGIVDGKILNIDLCDDCYKLEDTIKYKNASISQKIHSNSPYYCDFCGRTFDEISNTAYVGCEYCYKFFHHLVLDNI